MGPARLGCHWGSHLNAEHTRVSLNAKAERCERIVFLITLLSQPRLPFALKSQRSSSMCRCQRARPASPAEKRLEQILPDSIREARRGEETLRIKSGTWSDLSCLGDSYIRPSGSRQECGTGGRERRGRRVPAADSRQVLLQQPCKEGLCPQHQHSSPTGHPGPKTPQTFDGEVKLPLYES